MDNILNIPKKALGRPSRVPHARIRLLYHPLHRTTSTAVRQAWIHHRRWGRRSATRISVASRCPCFPTDSAPFMSFSTSDSVRNSRARSSALGFRRGGLTELSRFGALAVTKLTFRICGFSDVPAERLSHFGSFSLLFFIPIPVSRTADCVLISGDGAFFDFRAYITKIRASGQSVSSVQKELDTRCQRKQRLADRRFKVVL